MWTLSTVEECQAALAEAHTQEDRDYILSVMHKLMGV